MYLGREKFTTNTWSQDLRAMERGFTAIAPDANDLLRRSKMVIKRLKELLLSLAILPMLVQPVLAHVIWIEKGDKEGELEILYGHPELNETQSYDSIKFQEAKAYNRNGVIVPISVNRDSDGVSLVPQGDIAAITVVHDNGYFIRTGKDEYKNVFRPEALESNTKQVEISHTYKFAKAFYERSGLVSQPFGLPLEIIPQQDPFAVGPGGTLQIQVLFRGKPQQGVTVEYAGEALTTNENGIAFITLKQGELLIIEAAYDIPSTDDAATDEIGYATTLTVDKGGYNPNMQQSGSGSPTYFWQHRP